MSLVKQIQKVHGVSADVAKKRLDVVRKKTGLKAFDKVTFELYLKYFKR